jgi:hypothetical protein
MSTVKATPDPYPPTRIGVANVATVYNQSPCGGDNYSIHFAGVKNVSADKYQYLYSGHTVTIWITVYGDDKTLEFDFFGPHLSPYHADSRTTWNVCQLSGPNPSQRPTCESFGIAFDKDAGTIRFSSVPLGLADLFGDGKGVYANTVSGLLTFTPFNQVPNCK